MRVGVRVRHLVIACEVGLIVCWVGEGTVYILREIDCPHRRTRPESEGKVWMSRAKVMARHVWNE